MSKILQLSKLSRGHVELSESGSRLEIFPDQDVSYFPKSNSQRFFTVYYSGKIAYA